MKRITIFLSTALFMFISCKKETSPDLINSNTESLLSKVNITYNDGAKDSVIFKYIKGKLVSFNNRGEIIDSIAYDSQNRLIAYKVQQSRYNGPIVRFSIKYSANDTIIRIKNWGSDSSTILFKTTNNLLNRRLWRDSQSVDTILYTYDINGNLVNEYESAYLSNGQAFRNVDYTYSPIVLNPYSTVGNSFFWGLLYDAPHIGAKKMLTQKKSIEKGTSVIYNTDEGYYVTDTLPNKYPLKLIYKINNVIENWQMVYIDK